METSGNISHLLLHSLRTIKLSTKSRADVLGGGAGKVNDVFKLKENVLREFSGGLVVRILGFPCHGLGSTPGWGTEIPQPCSAAKKNLKENEPL